MIWIFRLKVSIQFQETLMHNDHLVKLLDFHNKQRLFMSIHAENSSLMEDGWREGKPQASHCNIQSYKKVFNNVSKFGGEKIWQYDLDKLSLRKCQNIEYMVTIKLSWNGTSMKSSSKMNQNKLRKRSCDNLFWWFFLHSFFSVLLYSFITIINVFL